MEKKRFFAIKWEDVSVQFDLQLKYVKYSSFNIDIKY